MKKLKQALSFMIVGCMSLSTLAFGASAADLNVADSASAALSVNAGEKISVRIADVNADGTVEQQRIFVDIPDNATNEDQKAIVSTAAASAAGLEATTRSAPGGKRLVGPTTRQVSPNSGGDGKSLANGVVGSGYYRSIAVYMHDISRNISALNIRLWTSTMDQSNCFQMNQTVKNDSTCTVVFYHGTYYGGDTFLVSPGDSITAFGSSTSGTGNVTTEIYGQA